MITTTWTSPADLLGRGSAAERPYAGAGAGVGVAVRAALRSPITSAATTGLTFGGTAVGMRPEVRQAAAVATASGSAQRKPRATGLTRAALVHNCIALAKDGTPLGIHPSGRPKS